MLPPPTSYPLSTRSCCRPRTLAGSESSSFTSSGWGEVNIWWEGAHLADPEPWKKSSFDCSVNKGKSTIQQKESSSLLPLSSRRSGLSLPYFSLACLWLILGQGDFVIFFSGNTSLIKSPKRPSI